MKQPENTFGSFISHNLGLETGMYCYVSLIWKKTIFPTFCYMHAFCVKKCIERNENQRESPKRTMKLVKAMVLSLVVPQVKLYPCFIPNPLFFTLILSGIIIPPL